MDSGSMLENTFSCISLILTELFYWVLTGVPIKDYIN